RLQQIDTPLVGDDGFAAPLVATVQYLEDILFCFKITATGVPRWIATTNCLTPDIAAQRRNRARRGTQGKGCEDKHTARSGCFSHGRATSNKSSNSYNECVSKQSTLLSSN